MKRVDPVSRNLDVARPGSTVGSDRGVGTYLAAETVREAASSSIMASSITGNGALILHDDEPTLVLLRTLVESAGLEATAVSSAYGIVMTDAPPARFVVLGMSAVEDREIELVSVLRRRAPEAWILVLFPSSLRERATKALTLGADAMLPEPFYASELTAMAGRALARRTAPPPPAPEPSDERSPAGAVAQLAAGVAHSIRNPLQILELQLGAVETDGTVDVAGMREQLRRVAGVVEGLMRYSGQRDLAMRPIDVAQLVSTVFGARDVGAAGAEITVRIGEARVEVLAAPELLRAGLESLRNRAVRVTPADGRIDVRTKVRTDEARRAVEINVTDGGPPLTEERRARLFDPYPDPQTVLDGTGLELAGLAGIVRDHGGTAVALPGAGGAGTTIVIRLPIRTEGPRTDGAPANPAARSS